MNEDKRIETRQVIYDSDLMIEAYHFCGIMQKFPNHFHDYYVIGFIESGKRHLSCKNKEYIVESGDMVFFNPGDNHTCEQVDNRSLDYRCLNIKKEIMENIVQDITGIKYRPDFTQCVCVQGKQVELLKEVHEMIMNEDKELKKEESFYILMEQLIRMYTNSQKQINEQFYHKKIEEACEFIRTNYIRNITLEQLCTISNMNKYSLIRAFTKEKAITPYRYLETIRINNAKRLLESGVEPVNVAISTGFTDQSHFTKFFKNIIGITPKQYMNIFKKEENDNE